MKKLIIAVALMAFGAGQALAADIPPRPAPPPYRPPPPAYVPYSWTGCFIGGNGGGVFVRKHWNVATGDPNAPGVPVSTLFSRQEPKGGMAGGQIGCDYQFNGGFVVGIQGDADWVGAKATAADLVNNGVLTPALASTDESKIRALGSVTGRIGYAWDRFLVYARGGYAWERDDYRIFVTGTGATEATARETRGGWTVGGGGEYAFTNWLTGFVEYDYYDFGQRTNRFLTPGGGLFDVADIRERKSIVKAGLNLRWGGGPVSARY